MVSQKKKHICAQWNPSSLGWHFSWLCPKNFDHLFEFHQLQIIILMNQNFRHRHHQLIILSQSILSGPIKADQLGRYTCEFNYIFDQVNYFSCPFFHHNVQYFSISSFLQFLFHFSFPFFSSCYVRLICFPLHCSRF